MRLQWIRALDQSQGERHRRRMPDVYGAPRKRAIWCSTRSVRFGQSAVSPSWSLFGGVRLFRGGAHRNSHESAVPQGLGRGDGDLQHPVGDVGRDTGGASLRIDLLDNAHPRGDMAEQGVRVRERFAFRPATMNHWLPPVCGWPVLAIATDPSGYWSAGFDAFAGSSSGMVYPGPPLPVPVGSPV